jgi:2-polyprenyl-6-methoxyphenol hydroxylase-like FAD-dependent oxidoreductase
MSAQRQGCPLSAPEYDVLIVGAGLVGLALAPALAHAGLRVALADRAPVAAPDPPSGDADWDTRVYAISPGSASFLRADGAWQELPRERIAAVESMHVEGDAGAALDFSAYELGERALAWIVEERALRAALVPRVHAAGVTLLAPCALVSLAFGADGATLTMDDGVTSSARLVVGADGLRSWTRAAAGIVATPRSYGQTAVVANFACARAHRGRAYHGSGPMAASSPGCRWPGAGCRWSGRRRRCSRRNCSRYRRHCLRNAWRRRVVAFAASFPASRRRPALRSSSCAHRRSLRIASRWSAMPRTACIR